MRRRRRPVQRGNPCSYWWPTYLGRRSCRTLVVFCAPPHSPFERAMTVPHSWIEYASRASAPAVNVLLGLKHLLQAFTSRLACVIWPSGCSCRSIRTPVKTFKLKDPPPLRNSSKFETSPPTKTDRSRRPPLIIPLEKPVLQGCLMWSVIKSSYRCVHCHIAIPDQNKRVNRPRLFLTSVDTTAPLV